MKFYLFSVLGCIVYAGIQISCSSFNEREHTNIARLFSLPGVWKTKYFTDSSGLNGLCTRGKDTVFFARKSLEISTMESPAHDYLMAFRNYHYETFFEYIFFDPKLRRLYRDSIRVDTIYMYQDQKGLVYPCRGCNSIAKIQFRQSSYIVPHKLENDLWQKLHDYSYIEKKINNGHLSLFYGKNLVPVIAGCQFLTPEKDYVVQIRIHSDKSLNQQIKLLSSIVFY